MTAIGFRILPVPKRPDKKLVAELAKMVTPHLSDSMERLYAGGPQLRPMHNGAKLCGPAFTVRTAPGDNLLVHKAIDTAEPGDVIVVDGGGFNDHALIRILREKFIQQPMTSLQSQDHIGLIVPLLLARMSNNRVPG